MFNQVHQVDLTDKSFIRGGFIPITSINNTVLFGFPLDRKIATLTDFGGHREDFDGDILDSALREYSEESYNLFGKLSREYVMNNYVLIGYDTIEIFLPVSNNILDHSLRFRELVQQHCNSESQSLIWLTKKQVLSFLDNPSLSFDGVEVYRSYYRIRDTLRDHRSLIESM